ncbi:UNC50 [Blepharisma stoltei]|uniref:UNC-50 family protein n=1 Tax=Blepharisma stoltei TaxID=1481888 RepID=A0AAU9JAL5_9CILI|nr:unnamed protein product [Blepharisma stoltei]
MEYQNSVKDYIKRATNIKQMDVNSTVCQMLYICFAPQKLARLTAMRKTAKNQWARDDPAFVVMLMLGLTVASFCYALTFNKDGFFGIFRTIFYCVCVYFLGLGAVISYVNLRIAENHLKEKNSRYSGAAGKLEWLYCFDIHCNSFLPVFLIVYVLQYFFLPLLVMENFFSVCLANFLVIGSFCYYHYLTCQGFGTLPFLKNTEIYLAPILGLIPLGVICIALRINLTTAIISMHF